MLAESFRARHGGSIVEGDWDAHKQNFMSRLRVWEGRRSPVDVAEEGLNKLLVIIVMNDAVMVSKSLVYTLLNMALGELGTATTLYLSTGEEKKDRRDEGRQNEDVLKMHAQELSSGLMKHMVKGSREESKSHCWQGGSNRVMWECILCKWHILPFCGFGIMKNSKKKKKKNSQHISSVNISCSNRVSSQKETCEKDTTAFPMLFCFCVHACYYCS